MSTRVRLERNFDVPKLTGADPQVLAQLDRLYRRPGFMIRRCHQFAVSIFLRECAAFALTPSQYGILYIVDCCPGVTQIGLSGLIGLDRSTTNTVVLRLMRNGYLTRRADANDRRKQRLTVTPAGRRLLAAVDRAVRRAYDAFLAPLGPRERRTFMACLQKLMDFHNADTRAPIVAAVAAKSPAGRRTSGKRARTDTHDGTIRRQATYRAR
ncbi:MAG TPA: MarR family transcriptional regulator [Alphaproteobacteria bacterium]